MLIICNGAFKSGSSWLHAIVVELTKLRKLNIVETPQKYTNDINSPGTITESRLQQFINNEDYIAENYLTKSHFFRESTLRKYYSNDVRILFIERDMRDAIVSHYFHIQNKYRNKISFSMYYFFVGRYKAYEISLFNTRCKQYMGEKNFFHFSDLISDFETTVIDIAKVIGINNMSEEEISQIKEQTTLDKLREELKKGNINYYPTNTEDNWKLFRQGKVGNWREHFKAKHVKDINKIYLGNFSFLAKTIYHLIFTLRRRIFRIE
jgi:hypothetical protein